MLDTTIDNFFDTMLGSRIIRLGHAMGAQNIAKLDGKIKNIPFDKQWLEEHEDEIVTCKRAGRNLRFIDGNKLNLDGLFFEEKQTPIGMLFRCATPYNTNGTAMYYLCLRH